MSIPALFPDEPENLLFYGQQWEDRVLNVVNTWPNYRATYHGMRPNLELRSLLKGSHSTERHAPDIVARTENGPVVWIECVRSDPTRTGNHAIQESKVQAQTLYAMAHPKDLFVIAFTSYIHDVVAWASISKVQRLGPARPYKGRGSGTPFLVVPANETCVGNYPQAMLDAACQT